MLNPFEPSRLLPLETQHVLQSNYWTAVRTLNLFHWFYLFFNLLGAWWKIQLIDQPQGKVCSGRLYFHNIKLVYTYNNIDSELSSLVMLYPIHLIEIPSKLRSPYFSLLSIKRMDSISELPIASNRYTGILTSSPIQAWKR